MSAPQFTPGPWESVEGARYVRAKGRCIAKLDWDIRDATDEANARLIAAAPDLYEALESAADICAAYASFIRESVSASDVEMHPYLPAVEGAAEDARTALGKARGETL